MSTTASPPADRLLAERGISRNFDAQIVCGTFDRAGHTAAFALGDGTLQLLAGETWRGVAAHEGAVLALAADVTDAGFLTGGDDATFRRIGAEAENIATYGMKWVEHVASWRDPKNKKTATGLVACAVGKVIHLFDAAGAKLKTFTHPSTVTGFAFDSKGKRLAASHYNGASVWFVGANEPTPRLLEWKGSHTGIALHPAMDAVVTAMQENALHGWRLADSQHMRMSGYPAKCESLGFTASGKWLASAGADALVLWPFFGGGPMGKAPLELAGGDGEILKRVACHPDHEVVACGFADGLVVIADIARERILPVMAPGRGAVTALAWNGSGGLLAIGTEQGFAAVVDFSTR